MGKPINTLINKTGRGSEGGLRAANLGWHNKEYFTLWALTKGLAGILLKVAYIQFLEHPED